VTGRLQLPVSVILPKGVIRMIEEKLNRFIGNGKDKGNARARVAWKMSTFPKKDNGLGIKKLDEWNRAAIMRHILILFAQAGSLWVAWMNVNLLKGYRFWHIKTPHSCSWSWRKLLKFRVEARNVLMFPLGIGNNIHLWTDWWHPNGVLLVKYVFQAIYDANSHLKSKLSKLSSIIKDGQWCWKPTRFQDLVEIQSKLFGGFRCYG